MSEGFGYIYLVPEGIADETENELDGNGYEHRTLQVTGKYRIIKTSCSPQDMLENIYTAEPAPGRDYLDTAQYHDDMTDEYIEKIYSDAYHGDASSVISLVDTIDI